MTAPAPAKAHPAVVTAAVLMVLLVCGTGAFALLSEVVTSTFERTNAFTPATNRLVVDAEGDVTIGPSSDGQVHVHTVVQHGLGEPEIVQESTAAGVRLDARCREFLAVRCDIRHEIQVPAAFEVVIDGVDGDVTASRLSGPLTVDRLTGDITAIDLTRSTSARALARSSATPCAPTCCEPPPTRATCGWNWWRRRGRSTSPQPPARSTSRFRSAPPTASTLTPTPAKRACSCRSTRPPTGSCASMATPAT